MIKAILFDMDGVLIDACEWHYEALNLALDNFGMAIGRDAHLSTFDGLPTRSKLKLLGKSKGLPEKLHPFINELKQSHTLAITYANCKPVFQHRYALSRLNQEGYTLAVCSNSIRNTVNVMMRLSKLEDFLSLQLSNEDVESPKPSPDIYLEAMSRLGLNPEECLVVEDNENGVKAAKASKAHVLRVADPAQVSYFNIKSAIEGLEEK